MGRIFSAMCQWMGGRLARYLTSPIRDFEPLVMGTKADWTQVLEPCDVLLVEGNSRVSTAIKYLTQSTWSHSCIYLGELDGEAKLLEADLQHGVVAVPTGKYRDANVRICRPQGLSSADKQTVMDFLRGHIGDRYDLRNVFDLVRYVLPTPPVPSRWRRRMITLGSSEPTRAICSTLIAEAFQQIRYPILPHTWWESNDAMERYVIHQIRHHSTFTPKDFDLSPYFEVVKPTLGSGFDFRSLRWHEVDNRAG
ncbi:MAG: lipo-like protein [Pseudomonadales bacterium]